MIEASQQGWNSANALTQLRINPSSHQWATKVSHSEFYVTHVPLCEGGMHTYICTYAHIHHIEISSTQYQVREYGYD